MRWKSLESTEFSEIEEMLAVNILPQTYLTRLLLPSMTSRFLKSHQSSLIIDFSSSACQISLPFVSVYAATKAYNYYFTQALSAEGPPGVSFLAVLPGMVATNMPKMNKIPEQPGTAKAEDVARNVLASIRQGWTAGATPHKVAGWVMPMLLNNPIGKLIVSRAAKSLEAQRKKTT
jgi:short-subunit dehydrogenase